MLTSLVALGSGLVFVGFALVVASHHQASTLPVALAWTAPQPTDTRSVLTMEDLTTEYPTLQRGAHRAPGDAQGPWTPAHRRSRPPFVGQHRLTLELVAA